MKKVFLCHLSEKIQATAQINHAIRITSDGIYSKEEIERFVFDLPSQKIADLEEALDEEVYALLKMAQNTEQPIYKRYDIQDPSDYSFETFDDAKQWLYDFWVNNPDDDMCETEHEQWLEEIAHTTDPEILDEYLSGIDYTLEEM